MMGMIRRREPLILQQPQHPETLQGAGQFDRQLARSVEGVNKVDSKAKVVAGKLAALKAKHAQSMDALLAKIEATDQKDTEVSQRAHASVDNVSQQVDEIDAGLRVLSNEA